MKNEIIEVKQVTKLDQIRPLVTGCIAGSAVALGTLLPVFAEGTSSEIQTAMTTAATNIASECTGMIATIAPVCAGILAAFMGLKIAIRTIKRFGN